ncbi:hypothetical protein RB653_004019 [Dictyostelium firmibasis]|uniref:Protein SEY1 homolog n=1 Tax=Dictyostelium firmibasis TaxID=79012 RepID=A0AAN7TYY0_9MYCE
MSEEIINQTVEKEQQPILSNENIKDEEVNETPQEQQKVEQTEEEIKQQQQQQEDEFVVLEETKSVEPIEESSQPPQQTLTPQETPEQKTQEHEYQDIVQFIDHKGDIVKEDNKNGRTTFLSTLSNRDDFLTKGFDYSVISILGPQSSGKSTLLNLLFNTRFAVMDASTGRKQTTQGVWMGVASTSQNKETFLILDVEGTDGRERGEDEKAFERKTSLFSLALSSVLIINMWAHDIGRYNAANISLLKTVFELNLQLFQKKRNHKILIFFLIRDHDGVTPLERLKATLMEDISKLWTDLQKPEEFEGTRESDFFDFEFTTLPHKIYSPSAFLGQVEQLKQRFSDSSANSFIPKREYRNDDIPADGFYQFSYQVWETIKSNRDLDLPSQKEMLALYRCDEFVELSMTQFTRDIKPVKEHIERGRIQEQFGEKSKRILDLALSVYDEPAQRYHLETVQKKRQVLTDRIISDLKYLFDKQMERLNENTLVFYNSLIKEFTDASTSGGSSNNKKRDGSSVALTAASAGIIPQFSTWSSGIKKKSIEYFEIVAKQSIVPGSDWSYENDLEQLNTKLEKELSTLKENQLVRLSKLMRDKTFQQELTPQITKITEQAPNNMWQKIKNYYEDALSSNEKEFRDRLVDFQLDEQKVNDLINKFRDQMAEGLKNKITERAEFLQMRMRKRFEEKFNMDNRNLPRKWTKTDDIASIFQEARQNAEKLIDLFSYLRLDDEDLDVSFFKRLDNDEHEENTMVNSSKIIIPYKDCCLACENFRLTIKSDYMQALSEQNRLTTGGGVPGYMIILLCVLGFNEFISIISSPLLLLLTILLGGVGFVLFKLGLAGPFIDYSSQILVHFINKVKDIVLHVEQLQEQNHNSPINKHKKD